MIPAPTGALDLWNLLIEGVFGSFWFAVIGLAIVIFIIMGFLGRISIYSCQWYLSMFLFAMSLGYGFTILNVVLSLSVTLAFIFSMINYISSYR